MSKELRFFKKPFLKKHITHNALSVGILFIGIGCILYALFGILMPYYYSQEAANKNYVFPSAFAAELKSIKNDRPLPIIVSKDLYPENLKPGDAIGNLIIPVLDEVLPIVEGTSDAELKLGVGHVIQTVLPGEIDNCVISAHRDTYFSELGKLVMGDQVIVETSAGRFTYEVSEIRIVDKDDRTVIVPTEEAILTMTTCYPFHYVGPAPDRYIVSAVLIN